MKTEGYLIYTRSVLLFFHKKQKQEKHRQDSLTQLTHRDDVIKRNRNNQLDRSDGAELNGRTQRVSRATSFVGRWKEKNRKIVMMNHFSSFD